MRKDHTNLVRVVSTMDSGAHPYIAIAIPTILQN
jgi:hypothetical protein